MPYSTRAPKELLHHLSALILRRPCVSADPVGMLAGERGSRLLDRRPPHYRCPAVPGHKASARAILMVLGPSVLPSVINCLLLVPRYCVLLSGLTQRHSSAASPVAHPASALAWNPTAELPGARIRSRRLHRGYCSPLHCWVLLMAAPDLRAPRSGRQSRRRPAPTLASELHHRTVLRTATAGTAARQFVSARPCCLSGLRKKPYPCRHPMSTLAVIDFRAHRGEVDVRGRTGCAERPAQQVRGAGTRHRVRSPLVRSRARPVRAGRALLAVFGCRLAPVLSVRRSPGCRASRKPAGAG
ncbi:hypothetical protein JOF58_004261 [Streptomyces cinnamonensis]|nr:hypothetical protein [Streptomyces virginiae]